MSHRTTEWYLYHLWLNFQRRSNYHWVVQWDITYCKRPRDICMSNFTPKGKLPGVLNFQPQSKSSYEILVAYSCFMYIKLFILHISAYSLKQVKGVEHKGFEPGGMAQHCLCTNHSVNGVFINLFMTKLKYIVFFNNKSGKTSKNGIFRGKRVFSNAN